LADVRAAEGGGEVLSSERWCAGGESGVSGTKDVVTASDDAGVDLVVRERRDGEALEMERPRRD
jgi:hypothetical protein